jgi:prepilin-type N-terminal cleavage/methylation domain-containing protein
MNSLNIKKEREGGFTLLELLIVISIIAILSVALVLVLNPAEALKKSRDAQRISDLSTLKTALGLYLTSTTTPYLGGVASNATCKTTPTTAWGAGTFKIYYSLPGATDITDANLDGATADNSVQATTPSLSDGTGWVPVNFDTLIGGSPISNLPVDPTNVVVTTTSTAAAVDSTALVYRYGCSQSPLAFEIDATLESDAYTVAENKRISDGGNNSSIYEVGTNLKILGTGVNF